MLAVLRAGPAYVRCWSVGSDCAEAGMDLDASGLISSHAFLCIASDWLGWRTLRDADGVRATFLYAAARVAG